MAAAAQVRLLPCLKEANHRCCCRAIKSVLLLPTAPWRRPPHSHFQTIVRASKYSHNRPRFLRYIIIRPQSKEALGRFRKGVRKPLQSIWSKEREDLGYNTVPRTECSVTLFLAVLRFFNQCNCGKRQLSCVGEGLKRRGARNCLKMSHA